MAHIWILRFSIDSGGIGPGKSVGWQCTSTTWDRTESGGNSPINAAGRLEVYDQKSLSGQHSHTSSWANSTMAICRRIWESLHWTTTTRSIFKRNMAQHAGNLKVALPPYNGPLDKLDRDAFKVTLKLGAVKVQPRNVQKLINNKLIRPCVYLSVYSWVAANIPV